MSILKRTLPLDWILLGMLLHGIGGIFVESSKAICYLLCGIGLLVIVCTTVVSIKPVVPFTGLTRLLFFLYLLWSLFIIIRPIVEGTPLAANVYSPVDRYQALSYLTPLIAFLGVRNIPLKSVLKFSYIYGIVGIFLLVFNFKQIFTPHQIMGPEEYQKYLQLASIPTLFLTSSSLLLLNYSFIPKKYRLIAILSLSLALLTVLYAARRGGVFTILIIFIFSAYLYIFSSGQKSKLLNLIIIGVLVAGAAVAFLTFSESVFSFFLSRLEEDTRSNVEVYFYKSFEGRPWEWLFGRGINGTYYCPFFKTIHRPVIETGYLQLILKGGTVNLAFFLSILGYSFFLGFFKSRNYFIQGMSLYIFAHILYLYPFGLPSFDFKYITLWVCIVYCQSKVWRNKSNSEIISHLNLT